MMPHRDIERGDEAGANHSRSSSNGENSAQVTEGHHYGSAKLSEYARAVMGNINYVYNFYGSEERVASYRRSAASCFQEIIGDLLHDFDPTPTSPRPSQGQSTASSDLIYEVNLVLAEEALAAAIEDKNNFHHDLQVSEVAFPALFRPSDIIVRYEDGHPRAFQVDTVMHTSRDSLDLRCWTWEFDGRFIRSQRTITVEHPGENKQVPTTALATWPLHFDTSDNEAKLRERGETFWELRHRILVEYDASASHITGLRVNNPRYMIDMNAYSSLHQDPSPKQSDREELDITKMGNWRPPVGDFLLLLPTSIKGFGFHDKKWRTLSVSSIARVRWNKQAFERLVLDADKKELIQALVTQHVARTNATTQRGDQNTALKLLFYGPPGTGKTLTAEILAEIAERPLYSITAGDIGSDPETLEKYLESALYIGNLWGCVVLLDEADLFLEQRTQQDFRRSALVSTFLRVLDYYEGILIFTMNRIGTFDEAAKSRIQLALYFPTFDQLKRTQIWRNIIDGLAEGNVGMDTRGLYGGIPEFARTGLNGRQIGSIITTARQLADFRGDEQLSASLIMQMIQVTKDFEVQIGIAEDEL